MKNKKVYFFGFLIFVLAFVFNLSGISASIDSASMGKSFISKKAKNVKIHPKVFATADTIVKGRPAENIPPGQEIPDDNVLSGYTEGTLGEPLADNANKYALLIGICDYADPYEGESTDTNWVGDICLSDGDALNMSNALIDVYGYDENNIVLLRDKEASSTRIIEEIGLLLGKSLDGDDEIVFFYSGHGVTGNYVHPDESDEDEFEPEFTDEGIFTYDRQIIWDDDLAEYFTDLSVARAIFIFDTCMAGGFRDLMGGNRSIVMASGEYETAYVYSTGENGEGMFSHWFVKSGMIDGRADSVDHDDNRRTKDVTIEEALDYASKKIRTQNPWMLDAYDGDLLLAY